MALERTIWWREVSWRFAVSLPVHQPASRRDTVKVYPQKKVTQVLIDDECRKQMGDCFLLLSQFRSEHWRTCASHTRASCGDISLCYTYWTVVYLEIWEMVLSLSVSVVLVFNDWLVASAGKHRHITWLTCLYSSIPSFPCNRLAQMGAIVCVIDWPLSSIQISKANQQLELS